MIDDGLIFETFSLEWLNASLRTHLPDVLVDSADLQFARDAFSRHVTAELRYQVLADRLPPARIIESTMVTWTVPATWWDHFKITYAERWWLRRLVRRHPARTVDRAKRVTLNVSAEKFYTFPEAKPLGADFGRPYRVVVMNRADWRVTGLVD